MIIKIQTQTPKNTSIFLTDSGHSILATSPNFGIVKIPASLRVSGFYQLHHVKLQA